MTTPQRYQNICRKIRYNLAKINENGKITICGTVKWFVVIFRKTMVSSRCEYFLNIIDVFLIFTESFVQP